MSGAASLLDEARALVGVARTVYANHAAAETLGAVAARLEAPLRVAIAGRVKAGKSTLLNALVGEQLAPTDAGECTRVVTWYQDGTTYQVAACLAGGARRQLRFHRDRGALEVDLGGLDPDDVDRLEVTWPSAALRRLTLIDTPGIGSARPGTELRTRRFLVPTDASSSADAVLYLMRHLHTTDLSFLESFHDGAATRPTPVNAVAVLSRADEIGVGRLDAMASARRTAARYRSEPKLRGLVQTVVPVAGLVAETAATLTEAEFRALRTLAGLPPAALERLLLSADRFVASGDDLGLTDLERSTLLERFGVYGLRLSATLLRRDEGSTATRLAHDLSQRAGVAELAGLLATLFTDRADVLKARTALLALEEVLVQHPLPEAAHIEAELERVTATAHVLQELRVLGELRAGLVAGRPEELAELDRLLGGNGDSAIVRLGLGEGADQAAIRVALVESIGRWRRRAESPLASRELGRAAGVAVRSCEGLLHHLVDGS